MSGLPIEPLVPIQIAYIVDDIEAAARHWVDVAGAGPFFVSEASRWAYLTHRGEPTEVHIRLALGQWGPVQLEFLKQLNDAPSPYLEFLARGYHGQHHLGFLVDDLDRQVAALDVRGKHVVYQGSSPEGFRFAYLDDDAHPGSMLELIERGPVSNALMAMVADAAKNWDGSDPIRYTDRA